MVMPRYAKKRDTAEPDIVDSLRKVGCWVYRELPCDLLVRIPGDPPGVLRAMECKTPRRTGNWSKDQRQIAQMEFMQVTGTPYVTTPEQAVAIVSAARKPGCVLVTIQEAT
jgi:hypothetical protein